MAEKIKIIGAKEHNLKNVSLEIPKNELVVFTGVSGSGKSSLAFDTIFAEGQQRVDADEHHIVLLHRAHLTHHLGCGPFLVKLDVHLVDRPTANEGVVLGGTGSEQQQCRYDQ